MSNFDGPPDRHEGALRGCLLGQAVGDAIGLPVEGLSHARAMRLYGRVDSHRWFFGCGMGSDDTEHAALTAQALLASRGSSERFARSLAWGLRWWFAMLPAGIGKATLLACGRLWLGFPPSRSGVFSAGNGPAMRSPILGVYFANHPERLREHVRISTRLTHTDPKAEVGAMLIAEVAAALARGDDACDELRRIAGRDAELPSDWHRVLESLESSLQRGEGTTEFAAQFGAGRGVSGYILHTVPVALHALLSHDNYRDTVIAAVACGGDTDTVAAIAGALAGARSKGDDIPPAWLRGYIDWPRSTSHLSRLARSLAHAALSPDSSHPVPCAIWAIPFRNAMFIVVLLAHVARRLCP